MSSTVLLCTVTGIVKTSNNGHSLTLWMEDSPVLTARSTVEVNDDLEAVLAGP